MTEPTEAPQAEVLPPAATPPEPGRDELVKFEDGKEAVFTPSKNYLQAVELGHVIANSRFFKDAQDPAQAAIKVMFGMDLGISPTAAVASIHLIESDGRMVPVIEGKVLAALIKSRPGYDYEVTEYTDEGCTIVFKRAKGKTMRKLTPIITFTWADAERADLVKKKNYKGYPRQMLMWRALAEGTRMHFPELLAGSPIYVEDEFGEEEGSVREALMPPGPKPLQDERAEELRAEAKRTYEELCEINDERLVPGRFDSMVKGHEHSHAQLEGLVASMRDLVETEAELQGLLAELDGAEVTASERKGVIDRLGRQSNNRERIDVVRGALEAAKPSTTE